MNATNVLIVDDSPYLHKVVKAHLGPDWIHVHSAFDGESALNDAQELQPSLILMDIDMPGIGGLEVCRQIKENPRTRHTPVIFLTADCSTHDKVKAFEMGAVDYITKPFTPEELRARVLAALRSQRQVESTAMIDSVTSLWNQSYLNVQMLAQLSLAERTGHPLSCVVADIDSLEPIHVTHGRHISEKILKNMASSFLALSRSEDVLCHLGRGRFVFLQPATRRSHAAHVADRMRSEIEHQLLFLDELSLGVTCSFGVADSMLQYEGSLLDLAEQGVDRAKAVGGNVVIEAGSLTKKGSEYPA
jgi:diguanylate cyclase (GGDEF)-like protein